jgi:hypothetical protein
MLNPRKMTKLGGMFDGQYFFVDGKKVGDIEKIKPLIIDKLFEKRQKLCLVFNYKLNIYFKKVGKKEFAENFETLVTVSENASEILITFRFTSKMWAVLSSFEDLIPPIPQEDISSWLWENQPVYMQYELGGLAEYCISGNIADFINPCRKKRHDVWYENICYEVKSSFCGFKPEKQEKNSRYNLWLWDVKEHNIKAMRESYSHANAFWRIKVK